MDYPVFSLKADTYDKLASNCKVFNTHTIEYYLWVEIPHYLNRDFQLVEIDRLTDKAIPCPCVDDVTRYAERECHKPWIRLVFDVLDRRVGLHTYKITLVNRFTNDVVSLFFNYIIQDDDPPKPYYYMGKYRGECGGHKC